MCQKYQGNYPQQVPVLKLRSVAAKASEESSLTH